MRNFSILVVDDDHDLARLIEKILHREGFVGTLALSAGEALARTEGQSPDLMLIDLTRPDLPGKDLIERLGEGGEPPPFIIIAREGDRRIAVEMMKLGALDYLIKDAGFPDLVPVEIGRAHV